VMGGIVLFVADQYLGLGLLVAFAMLITSFIQPLQRLLKPLTSSLFRFQHQGLLRHAGLGLLGLMVLLLLVPLPQSQVLDGVVEAAQDTPLYTDSGGIVQRVEVKSGQTVVAGQQVVVLLNPELDAELNGVAAQVMQAQVQENKALTDGGSDLYPIRERLKTLEKLQTTLLKQKQALIVRAPHAGIWVSPELPYRQASWLGRGAELGRVLNEQNHVFSGVIRQEDAVRLVGLQPEQSAVRIEGERDQEHRVQRLTLLPHSQKNLPSAALSPLAGGKVAISTSDPQGKQAAEQFFLLRAELSQEPRVANRAIQAGRSAWIKARLPAQPLALQAWRAVRQFFQRRYQL
jgi:putative peptide zinc metalloprotease protein